MCLWLSAAAAAVAQQIVAAEYGGPTRAYPHGVLGDAVEWASVVVTVAPKDTGGAVRRYRIAAAQGSVFEDTAPRLWDVDGDRAAEVLVVESHRDRGARLVVLGLRQGAIRRLAATPPVGRRFRWLAPVGAADLDGDGQIELALVETPHLGKTLQVWRYRNGRLDLVATRPGFSNHRIGWDHIPGGIRHCRGRPEIVTADGDWRHVLVTRLENGQLRSRAIRRYRDPASLDLALSCR